MALHWAWIWEFFTKDFSWSNIPLWLRLNEFNVDRTLGGAPERNKFRAKAHETSGLLRYVVDEAPHMVPTATLEETFKVDKESGYL
eukprot:3030093-Amphidinium_carterae.1